MPTGCAIDPARTDGRHPVHLRLALTGHQCHDGNNKRIDYAYDKLDRVVSISVHDGAALQTMVYDALGSLTTRTYGAVITRFTYDTYPSSRQITSAARSQGGTTETVVIVLVGAMGL